MRPYRESLFLAVACLVQPCQGWTPATLTRVSFRRPPWFRTAARNDRAATLGLRPQRETATALAVRRGPWGTGDDPDKPLPRIKMDDTPIPEYMIDMLKEAGEIDENGKPVDDIYDLDDHDRSREFNPDDEADYYDVPHGEMLFAGKDEDKEDTGSLMDTTVNNAVLEYGFPVEFFLDVLSRWGVTPPINQDLRLGDMIDAEQAAGLCEALTGLDPSDVRDNYLDDSVEDLAHDLDIPLPDLLQACAVQKINLPQGGDTHISIDEYKLLLDSVVEGGDMSPARRLFDASRVSNRWSGQKESEESEMASLNHEILIQKHNAGFSWKDGPPVLGDGEGEMPISLAHISGRIFGEELFNSGAREEEGDEDGEFFLDAEDAYYE